MQKAINGDPSQADPQKKKYQFKTEPWEHQERALRISWNRTYFALLMEYGTGKTKVIIDNTGILYLLNRIDALFIIAPNEVHERWISEQIPIHLPDDIPHIDRVWTGANTIKFKRSLEDFWYGRNLKKLKVFSMNVEALQSSPRAKAFAKNFLKDFRALLVVDESTRIKTPGAKRTKFIINQLSKLAKYRRTLTGNEITRSPFDVYSPYRFLDKDFWTGIENYHIFKHRFGKWKTQFTYRKSIKVKNTQCPECKHVISEILFKRLNGKLFPVCPNSKCGLVIPHDKLPKKAQQLIDNEAKFEYPVLVDYKNLDELRERTQSASFLVRKKDCMDLPKKIYDPLYTQMNDEQARIYQDLKRDMVAQYEGVELSVPNKIALHVRFQQIVGGFFPETEEPIGKKNPKMERMLYDLEDIDCGAPIIIWARFTAELRAIAARLKKEYNRRVALYYGNIPKPDRKKILNDFQDGKIGFFVANPQTAGTGLNLQRAYIHYYFSNSFNAEDRWQSEDRSHRGGQTFDCLYKDLFIPGTIDDSLKESNEKKMNLAAFFKGKRLNETI